MIKEYIEYIRFVRGYSDATCKVYENTLRYFATFAKSQSATAKWSTIDENIIREFIFDNYRRGVQAISINRYLHTLRSFFDFLCRFHNLQENPCLKFENLKTQKKLIDCVPLSVIDTLAEKTFTSRNDKITQCAIMIMSFLGLRFSELRAARFEDIIEDKLLRVVGKGNKERIIPLCDKSNFWLSKAKTLSTMGFLIEENGEQVKERTLRYRIFTMLVDAGCPKKSAHPHALRHSFATMLVERGYPLPYLQRILGHSSLAATQVYISVSAESLISSMRTIL